MLAPKPSQHLESENPSPGNPLQRFSLPGSCSKRRLFHLDELDLEDQRRVGWDQPVAAAARAVAEFGRDDKRARAAGPHAGDALVPTADHLPGAQLEDDRLTALARSVELRALNAVL